jgi:DNA-binding MarR family transcriptional regulator
MRGAAILEIAKSDSHGDLTRGKDPRLLRDAFEVIEMVGSLARDLEQIRRYQARAANLRLPVFSLLEVVNNAGGKGITVTDAAFRLGVRPQALSGLVMELKDAELIDRQKDTTDGRARRLIITPAGTDRLEQSADLRDRMLAEILNQIPSPNIARLVLGKLEAALHSTMG